MARPVPAKARLHARSRPDSATGTSTPARCIVRWRGWLMVVACPLDDEQAIAQLARSVALDVEDGRVVIDGHDVTTVIRTAAMDGASASVARLPAVRQVLVERQRALGAHGGIVMEGRDIGTVVFPSADLKIYLDADPAERARRRAMDPAHQVNGGPVAARRRCDGGPRSSRHDAPHISARRRRRCSPHRHDRRGGGGCRAEGRGVGQGG